VVQLSRRGPWLSRLARWRNWPVLVKLAAVLVVPVLVALSLGFLQVRNEVRQADAYTSVQRVIALSRATSPLTVQLQQERSLAAQRPDAKSGPYRSQTEQSDKAATAVVDLAKRTPGLSTASMACLSDLTLVIGQLPAIRKLVLSSSDNDTDAVDAYTNVITSVLNLDQALVVQLGDLSLAGPATALLDLEGAREQLRLQQAFVLVGIGRGRLVDAESRMVAAAEIRYQDRIANFQAVASPFWQQQFQQTVAGVDVGTRRQLLQFAVSQPAEAPAGSSKKVPPLAISADEWNKTSDATVRLVLKVENGLSTELHDTAANLQEYTSDRAGLESVVLVVTLLLAGGVGLGVGRYLLRSLSVLRRSALDVADRRLPEAVERIREGRGDEVTIDPVPVYTSEEFGQVARAFDKVHGQAVRSAAEQASLRSNLGNIFVNLSRRSQGLVERQLRLMEQLERHEEDPEQLANLFKLDHLATRMRRNNENLMVLSGLDPVRRVTKPLPLRDVLRAAVSEIEHYQRAVVRSAPVMTVVGYAAGDLVRLIAELLDNATAFSRPDTQVVVDSRRGDDGTIVIEVLDQGIGMGEAELAEANERVSTGPRVDVPVSRQMGLFVVGRLASRHTLTVRFSTREGCDGMVASVVVPADLVVKVPGAARPNGVVSTEVFPVVKGDPPAPRIRQDDVRPKTTPVIVAVGPPLPSRKPRSTWFAADTPADGDDVTFEPTPYTWFASNAGPDLVIDSTPDTSSNQVNPLVRSAQPVPSQPVPTPSEQRVSHPGPLWPSTSIDEQPEPGQGAAGLPKRVPKAGLFPAVRTEPISPARVAANRDPHRTRGFLASYQSGIRQDLTGQSASSNENERGQEHP
jgi:signal transduction histidine kinase